MAAPTQTKVFIVDDSTSVRERLTDLLGDIDGVQIVGEAETPADAIDGILKSKPACVVLDFRLRGGTGVEVIRAVRLVAPDVRFVVLTNHPNPQYRRLCLAAGADWFLDKSSDFTKIKDVILGTRAVNASFRP